MNAELATKKPWLALILLGGEYALLGWYLSAHHIFWLVGIFVVVVTFGAAWKSNPLLKFLDWFTNQGLLVVISVSLLFSLVVTLVLTNPILLSLFLLPPMALLYALLEMRDADFKQVDIFLWSVMMTGLGLGLGEAIDLFVVPSIRY